MAWNEIRELVDVPIALPFVATIKVDLPDDLLKEPLGRRLALDLIEAQISAFGVAVGQRFLRQRDHIVGTIAPSSDEVALVPWLVTNILDRRFAARQQSGYLVAAFDVNRPLGGQSARRVQEPAAIIFLSGPDFPMRPFAVVIEEVYLDEGSIWGKVKGTVEFSAAALVLAGAVFASPPVQDWRFEQKVEQTVQGQMCSGNAEWQIDLRYLDELVPESLNFEAHDISPEERTMRVCNVQLALKLAQGSPFKIDGIAGTRTKQALKDFAKSKGLPDTIDNETLRASLLQELQRGSGGGSLRGWKPLE